MKLIVSNDVANKNADLSTIPAFTDGTPENTVYWNAMSKEQAKQFFDLAIGYMVKYNGMAGQTVAAEILGALEDTYPDWVEEFEDSL